MWKGISLRSQATAARKGKRGFTQLEAHQMKSLQKKYRQVKEILIISLAPFGIPLPNFSVPPYVDS